MKKALIITCLLVSAFLFGYDAKAQEFVSNQTTNSSTVTFTEASNNVIQEVSFPLSSPNHESFTIKNVSLKFSEVTSGSNIKAYLLNSNQFELAASSATNVSSAGWKTFTFPSPYVINNASLPSTTPSYIMFAVNGVGLNSKVPVARPNPVYGSPFYGTFDSTHAGNFANNYLAYTSIGGILTPLSNGETVGSTQLFFGVNIQNFDHPLSITYPANNSTVSDLPLTIRGACDSAVDIQVFNGITYASSTSSFGSTRVCTSNAWSFPTTLQQGFWNVTASSTGQFVGIVFYYLAQSLNPNPITPTSTNPFATSTSLFFDALGCSSEAQLSLLCTFAERLGTGRPFSYFPQIIGATWSSMDNATRTDWIQPIELSNGFFIPGIRGDILDAVPTEFKNIMRPITTIGVGVFVLLFIWSLRKKII